MPDLPVQFRVSPLPVGFDGTPQQFADALASRLALQQNTPLALFVTGPTAPTSNQGPWLAQGVYWYVWDVSTGAYIPQPPAPGSLASVAPYAVGAKVVSSQTIAVNNTAQRVTFGLGYINPSGYFDSVNSRYTAPAAGVYRVTARLEVDNATGTAAGMNMSLRTGINGVFTLGYADGLTSIASPPGSKWNVALTGLIQLATNDYVETFLTVNDGVNTGNVTVAAGNFTIERLPNV